MVDVCAAALPTIVPIVTNVAARKAPSPLTAVFVFILDFSF